MIKIGGYIRFVAYRWGIPLGLNCLLYLSCLHAFRKDLASVYVVTIFGCLVVLVVNFIFFFYFN